MFASLHTAKMTCDQVQSGGFFARLLRSVTLGFYARRQRGALARLDDAGLADIGLTRDQAIAEASRWDVPTNWRH